VDVKRYSQVEGIDYVDTFAPLVEKLNIIRLLFALETSHNWILHQIDAKSTFLNGDF
jgi:hypothetical protein